MLKKYVKEKRDEQKIYYQTRYGILEQALPEDALDAIKERWHLNANDFNLVRWYSLWLAWDENSSSFDEWYLRWLEALQHDLRKDLKIHIDNCEKFWWYNKDEIQSMRYVYKYLTN